MDNFVFACAVVIGVFFFQNAEGDILVVVDDFGFSNPFQSGHVVIFAVWRYKERGLQKRSFEISVFISMRV